MEVAKDLSINQVLQILSMGVRDQSTFASVSMLSVINASDLPMPSLTHLLDNMADVARGMVLLDNMFY